MQLWYSLDAVTNINEKKRSRNETSYGRGDQITVDTNNLCFHFFVVALLT